MAENTEFLPFHAINEFMRPDFRLGIIRETLSQSSKTDTQLANDLNHQIKKHVSIPGFRNSDKAPAMVKVLPTVKAFEKHPDLVAVLISFWAELHSDLREEVFDLLKGRNWPVLSESEVPDINTLSVELIKQWPILPIKVDRTRLPGFFTHWPKDEDFEALYNNFSELHPNSDASKDIVSLMVVWLCLRLPYQVDVELPKSSSEEASQHSQ